MTLHLHNIKVFIWLLIILPLCSANATDGLLQTIIDKGTLVVGVKADFPPLSYLNKEGEFIGLEPELAQQVAKQFNVDLKLVPVNASNRLDKLESGEIDLVIATMDDTKIRRQSSGVILPSYFSTGITATVHKNSKIKHWADLYLKPVCLTKGTHFSEELIKNYSIKPHYYSQTLDIISALYEHKCLAWVDNNYKLTQILKQPRWQEFTLPLNNINVSPWVMAVKESERDSSFSHKVSDFIIESHKNGILKALEKKWGVKESDFLKEQKSIWTNKDAKGRYTCLKQDSGIIPLKCLSKYNFERADEQTNFPIVHAFIDKLSVQFSFYLKKGIDQLTNVFNILMQQFKELKRHLINDKTF